MHQSNLHNFSQIGFKPSEYFFMQEGDRLAVYNEGSEGALGSEKYLLLSLLHVIS